MNHPKSHPSPILNLDTAPGETPGSADTQSANHALGASPRGPGAPGRTGLSNLSGSRGHSASHATPSAADASKVREGCGGAPPGAPPTGLVLEGRTHTEQEGVGWTLRDDECPLTDALSFDWTTGEVCWRPTCKSARCRRCSRQVSAQTFALARRALEPVKRVRFITLTLAPEGWQVTRKAMQDWHQRLRRAGYSMHTLWVVERGAGGMKHVHVIQWGDFIPKEVLSASWPYGFTQIQGARDATDYLGKGVIRYVAKDLDGGESQLLDHMNLNGGRAAHWSRDFFGGMGRNAYRKANPLPGIYFVHTYRPLREVAS